jgi:prephenate dehydrogenase
MREVVARADRAGLLAVLEQARIARVNLPGRGERPQDLVEVRVPVPDRPGVIADVTTLAAELDVNVFDLEIAHSAEGVRGVLILVVATERSDRLHDGLIARGYRPSLHPLR